MRFFTTTLLTLLFAASTFTIGAHAQEIIQSEVDEFSGNMVVQSSFEEIEHEGFPGSADVSVLYVEGDYGIVLTVTSRDSWQLLGADQVQFIIDDDREAFDLLRMETETSGGTTQEEYLILLSLSDLSALASADDVRFRADRNVYTVTPNAQEAMELVINEVE